ncbi:carbamoyltransferase C-terminal domain-containing protein [Pseudomonas aeruginosa]|nr:carbamoyltransferase C-terminal domain-containing protein [Pseudomonas aeruginosa]
MADRINAQIKFRERWRPFCPSMLDTVGPQMFKIDHPGPVHDLHLRSQRRVEGAVPEVVHEDGTSRAQVLKREYNPRYYDLMKELENLTGNGVT